MGNFKGTEGNWRIIKHTGDSVIIGNKNYNTDIATVWVYDDKNKTEFNANAYLIGCAPELLNMLEEFVHIFSDANNSTDELELLKEAKDLIGRAKL